MQIDDLFAHRGWLKKTNPIFPLKRLKAKLVDKILLILLIDMIDLSPHKFANSNSNAVEKIDNY